MKQEINYNIDLTFKSEWWIYYGEYKKFVEFTFRELKGGEITTICIPLAFCIRHTLELGFKMNISELQEISGIKANIKFKGSEAHNICSLHNSFEIQIDAIFKKFKIEKEILNQFSELNLNLKNVINLVHFLDKKSYAFRYPFENDGITKIFQKKIDSAINPSINFKEIKEFYDHGIKLLTYTTDVIFEQINLKN